MTAMSGHGTRDHADTTVSGHVPGVDMDTGHVSGGHVPSRRSDTCPDTADTDTAHVSARRDHVHVSCLADTPPDTDTDTITPMTMTADGSGDPR